MTTRCDVTARPVIAFLDVARGEDLFFLEGQAPYSGASDPCDGHARQRSTPERGECRLVRA